MKTFLTYLRTSSLVLTCAIGLAACGGYSAVTLGGTVTGLTNTGLVLANGSDTVSVSPAAAATSTTIIPYSFPNQIDVGSAFHVTIQSQPQHMTCVVTDISGTAGTTSTTDINVVCAPNAYSVGGTISGVPAAGITLVNGIDQLVVAAGTTTFTMPTNVADGSVYGITVLTQPTGFNCSVVNGTGTMGAVKVDTVQVSCVPV